MWQSVEIVNIFNTLTLKQVFVKMKTFLKNRSTAFYLKALRLKTYHFHTKLPYQKLMLRQTEWSVQNRPITKNRPLSVTTLFFWKFCFSLRTSYKELIWCTNDPNVHILNFFKHYSFVWQCFFHVSFFSLKYDSS